MHCLLRLIALLCVCGKGYTQQPEEVQFDAASIKIRAADTNADFGCTGGTATPNPIRFSCSRASLRMLVWLAYKLSYYEVLGPDWTSTARYEVVATMPPNTTKDQFRLMLQNLLRDRFHLAVHRETRQARMYALQIAGKPRLIQSVGSDPDEPDDPRNMKNRIFRDHRRLEFKKYSMDGFARYLTLATRAKVLNETGIPGVFDISLDYALSTKLSADPSTLDESTAPSIFDAVKAIGLKLESIKGDLDMLIIDGADKTPTPN